MFTDSAVTLKALESAKQAYLKFVKVRPMAMMLIQENWFLIV